jgi:hypothetical protein
MAKPPQTSADAQRELLDRLRRMETRLTRFMEWSGMDTEVRRPVWNNGALILPTDATSLRDCLAHIPQDWVGDVTLIHKGMTIATITRQ